MRDSRKHLIVVADLAVHTLYLDKYNGLCGHINRATEISQ